MTQKPLHQMLRELREEQGRSLRAVARDLDVDPGYLSRLERGEKTPSVELQSRVARYYKVEPDQVHLAKGEAPPDVVEILREHPEILEKLRRDYGHK